MGVDLLHAHEAEYRALAIVLSRPDSVHDAVKRLSTEHFSDPHALRVWEAMAAVFARTGALSRVDLLREVQRAGHNASLERVMEYSDAFLAVDELEPTVEQLDMAATRRRLHSAAQAIAQAAKDPKAEDAVGLEVAAQAALYAAIRRTGRQGLVQIGDQVLESIERLEEARAGVKPSRMGTGFPHTLDRVLGGGLTPGDLIVLAGRTATGKTALAERIALHVAQLHGPVLYISLEMDADALSDRAVQMLGPATPDQMRSPDDDTIRRAEGVYKQVAKTPLYISDRRGLSVSDVIATSKAFQLDHPGMSLLVIDHFGELSVDLGPDRSLPRAMGLMASRLRTLAQDLGVPLLLLHQINRGVERLADRRPKKSDLRDSGRIEEVADIILLLYREQDLPPDLDGLAEIIVDKNRRTGWEKTMVVEFARQWVRYQEADAGKRQRYLEVVLKRSKGRDVA